MGAETIVAVDVLGKCAPVEKVSNVVSLVMRTYDIMDAQRTELLKKRYGRAVDLWLEPDMGDVSQYRIKFDQEIYDAGYRCGKENAEKIKNLIEC